jgi:hypothetical protein
MGNKITYKSKLLDRCSSHSKNCYCQYCSIFEVLKNRGLVESRWIHPDTDLYACKIYCKYTIHGNIYDDSSITFLNNYTPQYMVSDINKCISLLERYIKLKKDTYNYVVKLTLDFYYEDPQNHYLLRTIDCQNVNYELKLLKELLQSAKYKIPLIDKYKIELGLRYKINSMKFGDGKNLSKKIMSYL